MVLSKPNLLFFSFSRNKIIQEHGLRKCVRPLYKDHATEIGIKLQQN
jgi:hypothetical protein